VLVLPPDEAIAYLDAHNDGVMGNIVRLAQAMEVI
jgi:8-oxo-dGTP diphosphatase